MLFFFENDSLQNVFSIRLFTSEFSSEKIESQSNEIDYQFHFIHFTINDFHYTLDVDWWNEWNQMDILLLNMLSINAHTHNIHEKNRWDLIDTVFSFLSISLWVRDLPSWWEWAWFLCLSVIVTQTESMA